MSIYTKVGDGGETQLLGGRKTSKFDIRIEACGAFDELNTSLGVVQSLAPPPPIAPGIERIQQELFEIGAWISALGCDTKMRLTLVDEDSVRRLEQEIDRMEEQLPPLKNFLIPGGTPTAAAIHMSRSVCRRAERILVELIKQHNNPVSSCVACYTNRLSDWLFVAARTANMVAGVSEPKWIGLKQPG